VKKAYLLVAAELVAATFFIQPAHAFFGFKSPARVGLRDKISPDVKCPYPKDDWLSGSVLRVKNKNVNSPVAPKGACTHFELTNPTPSEIPLSAVKGLSVEGKRWQLGTENFVRGGFGPLAAVGGGLEPTGRMVVNLGFDYEGEFKVVAVGMDESTNTVIFEAFFRACIPKPHKRKLEWWTCAPFNIPSGITFALPEGLLFPVDITIGKPMKLPANVKEAIAQKLDEAKRGGLLDNLKSEAINTGIGTGSSLVTGGLSGGGGSSDSSPSSSPKTKTKTKSRPSFVSGYGCKSTSYGHKRYDEADPSRLTGTPTNYSVGGSEKLDKDAAADFDRMRSDASADGVDLNIVSGYRSVDSQKELWDRQVAKRGSESEAAHVSAPPGYSEHHTGYAFDVGSGRSVNLDSGFAKTPAYKWLKKKAKNYGFKQSFTGSSGVQNEPWHWSYVGKSRAKKVLKGAGPGNCSKGSSSSGSSSQGNGIGTGSYNYPTDHHQIDSPFGWRPSTHTYHKGVDFFVAMGTPIWASDEGVVEDSESGCPTVGAYGSKCGGGWGNFVKIRHPDGSRTVYAHQSKVFVRKGDRVSKKQVIGHSGSSGSSEGPHVHFELWDANGNRIDPSSHLGR
jgi:D-alanyl-D-alanine carboxypeptidase/Peptidase family M23